MYPTLRGGRAQTAFLSLRRLVWANCGPWPTQQSGVHVEKLQPFWPGEPEEKNWGHTNSKSSGESQKKSQRREILKLCLPTFWMNVEPQICRIDFKQLGSEQISTEIGAAAAQNTVCRLSPSKNVYIILFRIQSKISWHLKNQENRTCSLHERKSIEFHPEMNQMLELTGKDFDYKLCTITLPNFFITWNMFSVHENFHKETRCLSQEVEAVKMNQMEKSQKFVDPRCEHQAE